MTKNTPTPTKPNAQSERRLRPGAKPATRQRVIAALEEHLSRHPRDTQSQAHLAKL